METLAVLDTLRDQRIGSLYCAGRNQIAAVFKSLRGRRLHLMIPGITKIICKL